MVRTEHMFFEKTRLDLFRQMILSATTEDRCACLMKMLPMQQQDFTNIFRLMSNRYCMYVCLYVCKEFDRLGWGDYYCL